MGSKQRRSIRLAGYDYRNAGAYFITICSFERKCVFGRVLDKDVCLNSYGLIVEECWLDLEKHFAHLSLDEWVTMPNHFHAIVLLENNLCCTTTPQFGNSQSGSLATIVGQFKMHVTRRVQAFRSERNLPPVRVWQRNYYERIIRDEKELNDTRRYINENPSNWMNDENYTS